MNKTQVINKIKTSRIVPVIRTARDEDAEHLIAAIFAGGIGIFEITMSVPNAARVIENTTAKFEGEILVGAGTVLNREQAADCLAAGAKFIVSPVLNREVIEFCREREVAVFPAGLTPNEIYAAAQTGADGIKVFPADSMGGAKYLKSLKSVFPNFDLMPTGGVNLETISDFFDAGAFAVGVGGELASVKILREKGADEIKSLAQKYSEKLRNSI